MDVLGRCLWLGVTKLGRVVPRCSIRGPCGCRLWCCLAGGIARLFRRGCAAWQLCVCPPPFPSFPLARRCAFVVVWRFPPSVFFFVGGFACSSLCPPWAGARTGRFLVWLTGSLLMLWVAAGWAVVQASFSSSWVRRGGVAPYPPTLRCRLGIGGFNVLVAVSAGEQAPSVGGGVANERVAASSPFVAGWCCVVPRLWACFLPSRGVWRLVRVRTLVSVPRFGAVVRCGAPCCVVLCFVVLSRAVPCCATVRFSLSCRAVPCRAVVHLAVAWRAAPCCPAPRCVVLCCVVSWGALSRCPARRCAVLQCVVLPRVVPCFAVPWCVVAPWHLRSGVGWRRRWLDWPALLCGTRAEVMWLVGG